MTLAFPRAAISVQRGARERAPDSLLAGQKAFFISGARPSAQAKTDAHNARNLSRKSLTRNSILRGKGSQVMMMMMNSHVFASWTKTS
jgi:hypothetical protein